MLHEHFQLMGKITLFEMNKNKQATVTIITNTGSRLDTIKTDIKPTI